MNNPHMGTFLERETSNPLTLGKPLEVGEKGSKSGIVEVRNGNVLHVEPREGGWLYAGTTDRHGKFVMPVIGIHEPTDVVKQSVGRQMTRPDVVYRGNLAERITERLLRLL